MKLSVKQLGAAALASILAADMIPAPILAQEQTADSHPTEKTETVYTVLNQDGSVDSTTVSAWLHDDDGLRNISEKLDLTNVENVKGDEQPSVSGSTYTWNSSKKDIWYTGDTAKAVPVTAKISYELDGKPVQASQLSGKSGKLKITIHLENTISEQTTVDGRTVTIHPTFLAGGMMNVNTDHYKNVHCDQGKIVSDGTNEMLVFATVPGLKESMDNAGLNDLAKDLDLNDDIVVTANVTDYEDGEIMMAMTNDFDLEELPNVGSVSALTSGINQLFDASQQLLDGSRQLYDGTTQLKDGVAPLKEAGPQLAQLSTGATQLYQGASALETGINQYTDGTQALAEGTKQLYGITDGISQIAATTRPDGTQMTLANASSQLSQGLRQLKNSVDAMDTNGTTQLLETARKQLTAMSTTLATDKQIMQNMAAQLETVSQALTQLNQAGQAYTQAVAQVNDIIKTDNEKIGTAKQNTAAIKTDLKNSVAAQQSSLTASISAIDSALAVMEDGDAKTSLQAQRDALAAQQTALAQIDVDKIQDLDDLQTIDPTAITNILASISQGMSGLNDQITASAAAITQLEKDVNTSLTQIETLEQGMTQVQLPENLEALKQGVDQLSAGADALNTGVIALNAGLDKLNTQTTAALDQVNAGAGQLTASSEGLRSGASQLTAGTKTLDSAKGQLTQLTEGLDKLTSAADQLNTGAKTLYEGNVKFVDEGTGALKSKTESATAALGRFADLCDQVEDLNARYEVFSGAPEGAVTRTLYVFRTKEDK